MLDRLRVLESAATPAPWVAAGSGSVWDSTGSRRVFRFGADDCDGADAALTAAARNALPALLAVATAAQVFAEWYVDPASDAADVASYFSALEWSLARLREVERAPLGGDA